MAISYLSIQRSFQAPERLERLERLERWKEEE